MGFRINTNVLSLSAQRNLTNSGKALSRALERLASGSRINRAGDDAAGLAISEGLNSQVRGITVAIRNANNATGFLNTAEGALSAITSITQRLRELAIQASNGTLGSSDRGYLNSEKTQLLAEFDRIARQSNFNGTNLIDGSFQTTDLQVGVNKGEVISFSLGNARSSNLGALATVSGYQNTISSSGGSIVLNGTSIDSRIDTDDTVSVVGNDFSAIAVAARINAKAGTTKVNADVQATTLQLFNLSFATFSAGLATGSLTGSNFQLNGINITGTGINSAGTLITAINNFSNSTGVVASLAANSTSNINLVATDGRNVGFVLSAAVSAASFFSVFADSTNYGVQSTGAVFSTGMSASGAQGLSTGVATGAKIVTGAVKLRSAAAITVTGTSASLSLGFTTGTVSVNTGSAVNTIDLTTQAGAENALSVLDATLAALNSQRSDIGAVQSRLDSTVSNLSVTLENISAAKSQIKDADVAQETAELTRAQILQQAGIAVLGQANTEAQSALALLNFK